MSDQQSSGPSPGDGPVIGGTPPPQSPAEHVPSLPPAAPGEDAPVIGAPGAPPPASFPDPLLPAPPPARRPYPPDPYDLRSYAGSEQRVGYYGAEASAGGRTPGFYFFVLLALAVGGILVFLLFQLLDNGNGSVEPVPVAVTAEALIESPEVNDRITVGEERPVVATITSGEAVRRVELLIGGIIADQRFSAGSSGENTYAVALTARFEAAGEYDLVVRAFTDSGAEITSAPVRVVAVTPVGATPVTVVRGQIVAVASLRTGPSEAYSQAGMLEPGDAVTVTGKTRSLDWLQLERGGGLWLRRNAVHLNDSLDLVPIRDPGPEPTPAATPTPEETETLTPSPTTVPLPDAPDFISVNAVLVEGGATLRITISNVSTNPFAGAVVVGVADVPASPAEQVVNVSLLPNGTAIIDFALDPPVTEASSVNVTVDPDNAVAESNEDNNVTNFVLAAPPLGPVLSLTAGITGGVLAVTIANEGEALATQDARLVVSVPGEEITRTISPLAIAAGASTTIGGIAVPQQGETITVDLYIEGAVAASANVPNPNAPTATATPADG